MSAAQPHEPIPIDHHDEIGQLIREIHAERQEAREREHAQRWTVWVSRSQQKPIELRARQLEQERDYSVVVGLFFA